VGGPVAGRHLFSIHSGPDEPWIERLVIDDLRNLTDLDLEPLARGIPPGAGERDDGPLFLVCTNGRRDPCCAERGRPVAAALGSDDGVPAWECSHIGGDRFAATLVAFPHGLYFGRVDPSSARTIVDAYGAGRILLDAYRGRSSHPFAAQAAEIHLRRAHGMVGVDDLRLVDVVTDGARSVARFRAADGVVLGAEVRTSPAEPARPVTCHTDDPSNPPAYAVRELEEISPG
jgi:hypothetical protein